MPPITVHSATPDEYAAAARLLTLTQPHDPLTATDLDWQLGDQARWGYHAGCLLILDGTSPAGSKPLGAALYWQQPGMYHPQRFVARLGIHPQRQRQGLGSALWDDLTGRLAALDALSVRVTAREDHPDAPGFLTRRGGVADHWYFTSALRLADLQPERHADVLRRVSAQGIRLVSLAELRAEGWPDLETRLCALMNEVRLDVPRSEPVTPLSQEVFDDAVLGDPELVPGAYLLAERGGELLGQTALFSGGEPGVLATGLTGVVRACRGQGVASALKVQSLLIAREMGVSRVLTDNATTNAAMLAVNDRLGFVRDPATASYLVPLVR